MGESFKAYLLDNDNNTCEIRKLKSMKRHTLGAFKDEVVQVFTSLKGRAINVTLYWKDDDNNFVSISSDNDFQAAVSEKLVKSPKIYLKISDSEILKNGQGNSSDENKMNESDIEILDEARNEETNWEFVDGITTDDVTTLDDGENISSYPKVKVNEGIVGDHQKSDIDESNVSSITSDSSNSESDDDGENKQNENEVPRLNEEETKEDIIGDITTEDKVTSEMEGFLNENIVSDGNQTDESTDSTIASNTSLESESDYHQDMMRITPYEVSFSYGKPATCDNCDSKICGSIARYRCMVCRDYDLCEMCKEDGVIHEHQDFIRITYNEEKMFLSLSPRLVRRPL